MATIAFNQMPKTKKMFLSMLLKTNNTLPEFKGSCINLITTNAVEFIESQNL